MPVVAITAQSVDVRRIRRDASENGRIALLFGGREGNVVSSRSKGEVREPRVAHVTPAVVMGDNPHIGVEPPNSSSWLRRCGGHGNSRE
jgi:hypothetical protein